MCAHSHLEDNISLLKSYSVVKNVIIGTLVVLAVCQFSVLTIQFSDTITSGQTVSSNAPLEDTCLMTEYSGTLYTVSS